MEGLKFEVIFGTVARALQQIWTVRTCITTLSIRRKLNGLRHNSVCSKILKKKGTSLRRMRWAGHVARMGEDRGVHRV